jgi:hypothetical protein
LIEILLGGFASGIGTTIASPGFDNGIGLNCATPARARGIGMMFTSKDGAKKGFYSGLGSDVKPKKISPSQINEKIGFAKYICCMPERITEADPNSARLLEIASF